MKIVSTILGLTFIFLTGCSSTPVNYLELKQEGSSTPYFEHTPLPLPANTPGNQLVFATFTKEHNSKPYQANRIFGRKLWKDTTIMTTSLIEFDIAEVSELDKEVFELKAITPKGRIFFPPYNKMSWQKNPFNESQLQSYWYKALDKLVSMGEQEIIEQVSINLFQEMAQKFGAEESFQINEVQIKKSLKREVKLVLNANPHYITPIVEVGFYTSNFFAYREADKDKRDDYCVTWDKAMWAAKINLDAVNGFRNPWRNRYKSMGGKLSEVIQPKPFFTQGYLEARMTDKKNGGYPENSFGYGKDYDEIHYGYNPKITGFIGIFPKDLQELKKEVLLGVLKKNRYVLNGLYTQNDAENLAKANTTPFRSLALPEGKWIGHESKKCRAALPKINMKGVRLY